ncbi:MAG: metal-sensing transcriptional repressor [Ruminococcus sp.]|nr:metal-sensing transcriptional repressor [Ruminococcus sp.]
MKDKECCCTSERKTEDTCCERKKKRNEEEFMSLMNRLKRIEGQVRGVERMLENDAYCPDILTQVSAINSALNSFNKELFASHMKSCVVNDIRAGKDEVIDELVTTLQKIMK